ncbi:MAG TPA: hypothetical protein VK124_11170 [Gemmatimonadales bacterium]|nr:hypothetical protein [Gemmatimonadales bacterium]
MSGTVLACSKITASDQVVALDILLPDSGHIELGDTLRPLGRALNSRGDSIAAQIFWASLDTGTIVVLDSTTGVTVGRVVGNGRVQARVGPLRSNPQTVVVAARLDSVRAAGLVRDTVTVSTPDSLSDTLFVRVFAVDSEPPAGRQVVYAATTYPASGPTVRFVRGGTVTTDGTGLAFEQLRLSPGTLPDSVVVTATVKRFTGTNVPGSPVTFVVEFRP